MFLRLIREHPDRFFVPCYDFDLIWHAHQAHAREYQAYTTKYLGATLPHDDSVNDRAPDAKLAMGEAGTRAQWQLSFGMSFARVGAMWRGDAPHTWMTRVPPTLMRPPKMLSFKKGSFQASTAAEFTWAFKVRTRKHVVSFSTNFSLIFFFVLFY